MGQRWRAHQDSDPISDMSACFAASCGQHTEVYIAVHNGKPAIFSDLNLKMAKQSTQYYKIYIMIWLCLEEIKRRGPGKNEERAVLYFRIAIPPWKNNMNYFFNQSMSFKIS